MELEADVLLAARVDAMQSPNKGVDSKSFPLYKNRAHAEHTRFTYGIFLLNKVHALDGCDAPLRMRPTGAKQPFNSCMMHLGVWLSSFLPLSTSAGHFAAPERADSWRALFG
jgi:hypothetical protein